MKTIITSKKTIGLSLGLGAMFFAFALLVSPIDASAQTITRQLELGMRGSDVSALQTYLAQDSDIYPSGLVTGYFGQLTKAAVERFQTLRGIVNSGTPATTGYGRVGPLTLAAINSNFQIGGDRTSPSINSLNISTGNTTASLNWNTNENSSATVYFSATPLPITEANANNGVVIGGSGVLVHSDMRTSHAVTLSGLNANTTYYYVVYAKDNMGNESITWPSTFRTQ